MSEDASVMLKDDHKEIRADFREFQKSSTTNARKQKLVERPEEDDRRRDLMTGLLADHAGAVGAAT